VCMVCPCLLGGGIQMANINDIAVDTIDGSSSSLGDYAGSVRLVVNVASQCGLTPQYEGLEAMYEKYRGQGLQVLGFPANNFGAQEPGSNDEIHEFCTAKFGVQFPMFSKISVKGDDQHPLYAALIDAQPSRTEAEGGGLRAVLEKNNLGPDNETDVMWNFEKFLVSRDGDVIGRFAPDMAPDDPVLVSAVEAALG
jgi:glutathione peroxidase